MIQRILAVDDEPDLLRLLERIVHDKTEYKITTTNNSLEVPDLLQTTEFDLIISDLKMPGLNGLDLLEIVNKNERKERVILVTAFGSLDSAKKAVTQGVFDYLTKPFRKEEILLSIERAMKYQRKVRRIQQLEDMFEIEPYISAKDVFRNEYVKKLLANHGNDLDTLMQISGMPEQTLKQEITKIKAQR